MADDPVSRAGPVAPRDWPPSGCVRPILSSRVERLAKGLLAGRPSRATPGGACGLDAVYREVSAAHPRFDAPALIDAYRDAADPAAALETSFAALALAIAAQCRPRVLGLAAFLELCYRETALDGGVALLEQRLREAGGTTAHPALCRLRYDHGWRVFAADVRTVADSLTAAMPPPRWTRMLGADVGPRRVVVRMSGGLGNQMFQYAAGLAYAHRARLPLRLDLFHYELPDPHRQYLLGRLRAPVRRANSAEVLWARRRPFWELRGFFADILLSDSGSLWLSGFWEDPAYFAEVAEIVRRQFVPRDPAIAEAASALVERARIGAGPVVGVHLRRGDRGPGGGAYAPFSTMPAEYYRQAADRFPAGTNFLVFSDTPDDIAWCRENLGIEGQAQVTFGDGRDPILDMAALSACDHVILSSGTFSWWGGFLGQREGRRVIVPNPLQALSAEKVVVPPTSPPLDGWELVSMPPQ